MARSDRDAGEGGAHRSRARRSSSDEDDDRLEAMLARHQQRDVANWGAGSSEAVGDERRRGPGTADASTPSSPRQRQKPNHSTDRRGRYADLVRDGEGSEGEEHASASFGYGDGDFDSSFQFDTEGDSSRALSRPDAVPPPSKASDSKDTLGVTQQEGLLLPSHVLVERHDAAAERDTQNPAPAPAPVDAAESDARDMGEDNEGAMGEYVTLDGGRNGPVSRKRHAPRSWRRVRSSSA